MLLVCFDDYSTDLITILLPRILLNVMWYVWHKQRCSANVRYGY